MPVPASVSLPVSPVFAPPAPSPAPAPAFVAAAPPTAEVSPITVLINVIPKRAIVFRDGERLGAGLVAVNVAPNQKLRLTAQLPGYEKARFTVDGARDTITIHLNRISAPAPAVAPPSAAPADAANGTPPSDPGPTAAPSAMTVE